MAQKDHSLTFGWDVTSPADVEANSQTFSSDGAASSGDMGEGGIVFVTETDNKDEHLESRQGGMIALSTAKDSKLEELWNNLERVMTSRTSNVQSVMEEFGIADVPPATDELEEQLWDVVERKMSTQEAADLV